MFTLPLFECPRSHDATNLKHAAVGPVAQDGGFPMLRRNSRGTIRDNYCARCPLGAYLLLPNPNNCLIPSASLGRTTALSFSQCRFTALAALNCDGDRLPDLDGIGGWDNDGLKGSFLVHVLAGNSPRRAGHPSLRCERQSCSRPEPWLSLSSLILSLEPVSRAALSHVSGGNTTQ